MTNQKKYVTINTEIEKRDTKKIKKFSKNLLTKTKKCATIKVQIKKRWLKTMKKEIEKMINYELGIDEICDLENILEKICKVDENITVKNLLKIIKKPINK